MMLTGNVSEKNKYVSSEYLKLFFDSYIIYFLTFPGLYGVYLLLFY